MSVIGDLSLWRNGPQPGCNYNFPGGSTRTESGNERTLYPMTTGSSVLGLKFDGGVVIAADTLGSYGSLARYRDVSRVMKVNDTTILGAGGDYADYQWLKAVIEQRVIDEECLDDGFNYSPKSLHTWLTRIMYNMRSKFNPLWNTIIVGGLQNGQPYLGYVDKIGTAYQGDSLATGFGAYMTQPLLREAIDKNPNMTEVEAVNELERCLKVLFYRDARSINRYELAVVTKDGARIEKPRSADTQWGIAHYVKGYE